MNAVNLRRQIKSIFRSLYRTIIRDFALSYRATPLFAGNSVIVQQIESLFTIVNGIEVRFGTYGRTNTCHVVITLFNSQGIELVSHTVNASELNDNAYYPVKLAQPHLNSNSTPEVLYVAVASRDSSQGNYVALWEGRDERGTGAQILPDSRDETLQKYILNRDKSRQAPPKRNFAIHLVGSLSDRNTRQIAAHSVLVAGPVFAQQCDIASNEILGVSVKYGTYHRKNRCNLKTSIYDHDGIVVFDRVFSAEELLDNHYCNILFDTPLRANVSKKLLVTISSPDGVTENSVAIWEDDHELSNSAFLIGDSSIDSIKSLISNRPPATSQRLVHSLAIRLIARSSNRVTYRLPEYTEILLSTENLKAGKYCVVLSDPATNEWIKLSIVPDQHILCSNDLHNICDLVTSMKVATVYVCLPYSGTDMQKLVQIANKYFVPIVALFDAPLSGQKSHIIDNIDHLLLEEEQNHNRCVNARNQLAMCHVALPLTAEALNYVKMQNKRHITECVDRKTGYFDLVKSFSLIMDSYRSLMLPRVSIVTILYNKSFEIIPVLDSYYRQTYQGDIEVIFVDDDSPDDSSYVVETYFQKIAHEAYAKSNISYKIIRNESNLGNCHSRNNGIRASTGDLIIIVDADCLLNNNFVKRHVEAHAYDDCEMAIGPYNIETNGADPLEILTYYEKEPSLTLSDCQLQNPANPQSFVNCITRNFSVKRSALGNEDLFDPLFTYSASPESGYGWEDVEMGYRLYCQGARLKFIEEAFSIHISERPGPIDKNKPVRSMRNFRRLLEKHPNIQQEASSWTHKTYLAICSWADGLDVGINDDRKYLDSLLKSRSARLLSRSKKRYRVLSYRWHVPHQYELYKLPLEVTLVTGLGSPMVDDWAFNQRPLPQNAKFIHVSEISEADYDFAILHFDENVLSPENTNGIVGDEWGKTFRWFRDNLSLPKVAICHGTPQFYGQYDINYRKSNLMQIMEEERIRLVDYLGTIPVIVNSHQARREWKFHNSRVIWHGFDPGEFLPATYEKGILSPRGPLVMSRPHYRGYFLYRDVRIGSQQALDFDSLSVPEPNPLYKIGNAYAFAKFRNYVDEIRRYSVYFNPTLRSPMPRARCEPMMCGLVTVSAKNHDIDMFIQNGINGFYSEHATELREQLVFLSENPAAVRKMGNSARRTAMEIFHIDRYLEDWLEVISGLPINN